MVETGVRTWTIEEYHRMLRTGILTEDERVELLSGQILTMSPREPPHSATIRRASRYLDRLLAELADVRAQLPITLRPDSEPEPDIAIVRLDPDEYADHHPSVNEIFWAIEISDTTLRKDLERKASVYARGGIPEYWVLDIKNRLAYIFRDPGPEGYRSLDRLTPDDTVRPLAFPSLEIALTELFLPG